MATNNVAAYNGLTVYPSTFWGSPVLQANDGTLYCPGFIGNTYALSPTDYVTIGNYQTPGIAKVTCTKQREVDKKKIKGADGARITLSGLDPAVVEIRIKIWTPEQLRQLDILRSRIFPGPQNVTTTTSSGNNASRTTVSPQGTTTTGANGVFSTTRGYSSTTIPTVGTVRKTVTKSTTITQAYNCTHPTLKTHGVRSLIFTELQGPDDGDEIRTKVFVFKAMEFAQPKKGVNATVTPTSAQPKGSTLEDSNNQTPGTNPANLAP